MNLFAHIPSDVSTHLVSLSEESQFLIASSPTSTIFSWARPILIIIDIMVALLLVTLAITARLGVLDRLTAARFSVEYDSSSRTSQTFTRLWPMFLFMSCSAIMATLVTITMPLIVAVAITAFSCIATITILRYVDRLILARLDIAPSHSSSGCGKSCSTCISSESCHSALAKENGYPNGN